MPFDLVLTLDLGMDSENDFFDEIVAQNEGEAIQALAFGKLSDFAKVTPKQKKDYVVQRLSEQFTNIYFNAKDDRALQSFRQQLQNARKAVK